MAGIWQKFRGLITVLGMAVAFSALVFFGILRTAEGNYGKMVSIQQSIVDREILEEQSQEIPSMRDTVDRIRSADGRLDVFLPKDRIVSFAESVELAGKDLGVDVKSEASPEKSLSVPVAKKKIIKTGSSEDDSASDSPEKPSETIASLLPEERSTFITFQAKGPYDRVLALLRKIDTMPTMLDVLSVSISPASKDDQSTSASISVPANPFLAKSPLAAADESASDSPASPEVLASFSTVIYTAP